MNRIDLEDGTWLAPQADGAHVWHPEECMVNVAIAGEVATLTADDAGDILATLKIVTKAPVKLAGGRKARGPAPGPKPAPQTPAGDRRPGELLDSFIASHMGALPRAAVCVWLCLYGDMQADGISKTGIESLAKRSKCDRSTVIRSIQRLVEAGRLELVRRGGIGRGASSYRVK